MNLIASASTFGFFTLISRILGYVRDILIAIFLGTSIFADAFLLHLDCLILLEDYSQRARLMQHLSQAIRQQNYQANKKEKNLQTTYLIF